MERRGWRILTVVFAVTGILMLVAAYIPIAPMDTYTFYGDKADGYIRFGNPQPSGYTILTVANGTTSFLYFDTSSIPDSATITSAMLMLKVKMVSSPPVPMFFCADSHGTYPHKPYIAGDDAFDKYDLRTVSAFTDINEGKWDAIPIPTKMINKKGWTKLALFTFPHDDLVVFYSANSFSEPKLIVTYTVPKYHLTIKTNPSYCDVTVAGETKNSGTSGATFYLTGGTYRVTVSKDGYVTKTTTVYLHSDKTITITLEPEVHEYTLTVHTSPSYCNVKVTDGNTWSSNSGADGECKFTLEEGNYHITVSKEGYKAQTTTINLNSNKDVFFYLEPEVKEYILTVYVDPIGATVEVGGQTKIVPSTGHVDFTLEEGEYTVTIYKDGYNTVTRQVNLNQNTELHVSLTPQRPDIVITCYMNVIGLTMLLLAVLCGVKGWYL